MIGCNLIVFVSSPSPTGTAFEEIAKAFRAKFTPRGVVSWKTKKELYKFLKIEHPDYNSKQLKEAVANANLPFNDDAVNVSVGPFLPKSK